MSSVVCSFLGVGLACVLLGEPALGQAVQATDSSAPTGHANAAILVTGDEIPRPLTLTATDLRKLPRRTVRASDHGKPPATFEGVSRAEMLRFAGVRLGRELRGKRMASYVLVEAADNYRVLFALAELDPDFTSKLVLLADRMDGRSLASRCRRAVPPRGAR